MSYIYCVLSQNKIFLIRDISKKPQSIILLNINTYVIGTGMYETV